MEKLKKKSITQIEDKIFDKLIPPDTVTVLGRLRDVMSENGTRNLSDEVHQKDFRIHKLMWLLNYQFYGSTATIDLQKVWKRFKLAEKLLKVDLDVLKGNPNPESSQETGVSHSESP